MAVRKVFICDCCNEEILDRFYKIQGFNVYLGDSSYRGEDMMICNDCFQKILKEVNKNTQIQFDFEIE